MYTEKNTVFSVQYVAPKKIKSYHRKRADKASVRSEKYTFYKYRGVAQLVARELRADSAKRRQRRIKRAEAGAAVEILRHTEQKEFRAPQEGGQSKRSS